MSGESGNDRALALAREVSDAIERSHLDPGTAAGAMAGVLACIFDYILETEGEESAEACFDKAACILAESAGLEVVRPDEDAGPFQEE